MVEQAWQSSNLRPCPLLIWHAQQTPDDQINTAVMSNRDPNEAKQKRARSQLSCTACRQGKLRCNRATPCDQCIKRSKDSACSYLPPKTKSRGPQDVKSRIHHLEQLVVDLMNSRSSNDNATTTSSGRSNSTAASVRESPSTLHSDSSRSATRDPSEADKTLPEVTPPYSEDGNSPTKQHQLEAPQQLDSFGHLKITRDGTRYVRDEVKSTNNRLSAAFPPCERNSSMALQCQPLSKYS